MTFLYNLGIGIYYFAVLVAALFNRKARLWIKGRRGQFRQMKDDLAKAGQVMWIHAASLGEFEQGRPVIEKWKETFPESTIVLTFFSPSGYEVRKNYPHADFVYYLPLDTRRNARRFIQILRPEYAIFIKYEFWYHFLNEAKRFGTKALLISAVFRPEQLFFKTYGQWYRTMLFCFHHIFVQDELSLRTLTRLGDLNVSIAGDTRFDRVAEIAIESQSIEKAANFARGRFTYVFGSTWHRDEDMIIRYINEDRSDACYILAPHEIGATHIRQLTDRLHKHVQLYSMAVNPQIARPSVLIIDNIGLLASIYRYGDVAYVGGGFGKGIHNILEPAVYGMPVIFGPKYDKFREAIELVAEAGAFTVKDYESFRLIMDTLREDANKLTDTARATKQFVQRNLGATKVIFNYLKKS